MHTIRCFTTLFALIAAAGALGVGPTRAAEPTERELIGVLQSSAPAADKAITCKKLAIYGHKDAVPALAPLLADEQLASWALIALEAIPDPAADAALRDALGKLQGRLLVGVINSLGVRRDANAVDLLAAKLKDADPDVASAAAVALGHIGGASALKSLEPSLADANVAVRSAVAEGCVLCAERLLAEGKAAEAVAIYDKVRGADVPRQRIVEATRGAILARGTAGVPLLLEQLRSTDKAMYRLGLIVARELPGAEVSQTLAAELVKAAPERQVLLLAAMADRGDAAVLPAVRGAAKTGAIEVRVAAIAVLKQLGDVSCVPELLDVAAGDNAELADAAKAVLAALPGEAVDADLVSRLAAADGKTQLVLIDLAGQRRIAAATPALLKAADNADAQTRRAAIAALGATVEQKDLAAFVRRVASPGDAEDAAVAEKALRAAAIRMPDREACAAELAAAMAAAPVPAKRAILEILGLVGGSNALTALGAAAKDADPTLQDAATRLLGGWMALDAAPVLLDVAKLPTAKYKVRAIRGYIRLARQFAMPDAPRVAMCRDAMAVAERPEDKRLVLAVIERYPSLDMLKLAVAATKVPAIADEAGIVAMAVAQKVQGHADEVRGLLVEAGHPPVKVEIVKAEYGAGDKVKDVTAILRPCVRNLPLILVPAGKHDAGFGDPAPGAAKQLKIRYQINGKPGEVSLSEGARVLLPLPN